MTDISLCPDIDSDLMGLVDRPDDWREARARCRGVQLYAQQLWAEADGESGVGLNTWPRLRDAQWFSRMKALGMPLTLEGPAMKDWSCDGAAAAEQIRIVIQRVRGEGHEISAVSLDEPLQAVSLCHTTLEGAVAPTARVIQAGRAAGCAAMGLIVAYPASSAADSVRFMELLQQAGASPSHLHVDVDVLALKHVHAPQQSADLRALQTHCKAWGIPFGIILWGQDAQTPAAWRTTTWAWFTDCQKLLGGHPDRYVVQSWAHKNLPPTLPESDLFSHTALMRDVAIAVQGHTGDADMTWTEVKVVGKTLTDPHNGTVLSYGPLGWEPNRPVGTAGAYEVAELDGSFATYHPTPGVTAVFPFRPALPNTNGLSAIALSNPV